MPQTRQLADWLKIQRHIAQADEPQSMDKIPAAMLCDAFDLVMQDMCTTSDGFDAIVDDANDVATDHSDISSEEDAFAALGDIFDVIGKANAGFWKVQKLEELIVGFGAWVEKYSVPAQLPTGSVHFCVSAPYHGSESAEHSMRHLLCRTKAGIILEFEDQLPDGSWISSKETVLIPKETVVTAPVHKLLAYAAEVWQAQLEEQSIGLV